MSDTIQRYDYEGRELDEDDAMRLEIWQLRALVNSHEKERADHLAAMAAKDAEIAKLRSENAALLFRVSAFYSGNPQGGIVQRLEQEAAALRALVESLMGYAAHADTCGDADAYNDADLVSCNCGLDGVIDAALAARAGGGREPAQ